MELRSSDDYRGIFLSGVPLLDVRAPVEFKQGAFPGAVNRPLLDDNEREQVGICYKEKGPQAATALGHQLVQGECKATRIEAWQRFATIHPDGLLYCFRGGQRSKISQQWLAEAGIDYPRISGGYKAMRRFLIEELARCTQSLSLLILGGRTGTAKTKLLQRLTHKVDLEALANHRGSAFGRQITPQPTPINFENALAIALLQQQAQQAPCVVLEDEGPNVGSVGVPQSLCDVSEQVPLVILEASLEQRVDEILQEYVIAMPVRFQASDPDQGFSQFSDYLLGSLHRIRKRLGGERYQHLNKIMSAALATQQASGDVESHRAWIAYLLEHYYDPMYDYQITHKQDRIVYRGQRDEVLDWLQQRGA